MSRTAFAGIALLLLFSFTLSAQSRKMKVYYFRGDVQYKDPGTSYKKLNQVNIYLNETQTVKVGSGSQLVLVHPNGKNVTVNQPQEVAVKTLLQRGDETNNSGETEDYLSFIWHALTGEHGDVSPTAKTSNTQTGVVVRGECKDKTLMQFPLNGSLVRDSVINFSWKGEAVQYTFRLYRESEGISKRPVFQTEVTGTQLSMRLDTGVCAAYDSLYWEVTKTGEINETCPRYKVVRESAAQKKQRETDMARFNIAGYDEAMQEHLLGAFYEKHRMYQDALGHYERSVSLAPANDIYRSRLVSFRAQTQP